MAERKIRCNYCRAALPMSSFSKSKIYADGESGMCKACHAEAEQKRKEKNRDGPLYLRKEAKVPEGYADEYELIAFSNGTDDYLDYIKDITARSGQRFKDRKSPKGIKGRASKATGWRERQ